MNLDHPPQFNKKPPSNNLHANTTGGTKVSPEQQAAIKKAAETGKQHQQEFPEIALDYINGISVDGLIAKYDIQQKFGLLSAELTKSAVTNALGGYKGYYNVSYTGLITDPEIFKTIGKKHMKDSSKRLGEIT